MTEYENVGREKTEQERHAENLRKAEQAGALAPAVAPVPPAPVEGTATDENVTRDETGRWVAAEGSSGEGEAGRVTTTGTEDSGQG